MKYGILGDIHGNLSALRACLQHLQEARVDSLISLGDVVGYGAAPGACIDLLREAGAIVVQGNHDAAVAGQLDLRWFNPFAARSVRWTRSALSLEQLAWLGSLPLRLDLEDCSIAHGTYDKPERFRYVRGPEDGESSLEALPRPVGFVGHTHQPLTLLRLADDPHRTSYTHEPFVDLNGVQKALINVGSVGQPRDLDSRAACALFDSEAGFVRLDRLEYDLEREAERILDAGLPSQLGERLRRGA